MKHRQVINLIAAVVLVGGIAICLWPLREPPKRVRFAVYPIGYTNDAAGNRLHTYGVTNLGPASFQLFRYTIEARRPTGMTTVLEKKILDGATVLDAREATIVSIPAPTGQTEWRVLFSVKTEYGVAGAVSAGQRAAAQFLGLSKSRSVTSYQVDSDWITE